MLWNIRLLVYQKRFHKLSQKAGNFLGREFLFIRVLSFFRGGNTKGASTATSTRASTPFAHCFFLGCAKWAIIGAYENNIRKYELAHLILI